MDPHNYPLKSDWRHVYLGLEGPSTDICVDYRQIKQCSKKSDNFCFQASISAASDQTRAPARAADCRIKETRPLPKTPDMESLPLQTEINEDLQGSDHPTTMWSGILGQ